MDIVHDSVRVRNDVCSVFHRRQSKCRGGVCRVDGPIDESLHRNAVFVQHVHRPNRRCEEWLRRNGDWLDAAIEKVDGDGHERNDRPDDDRE